MGILERGLVRQGRQRLMDGRVFYTQAKILVRSLFPTLDSIEMGQHAYLLVKHTVDPFNY